MSDGILGSFGWPFGSKKPAEMSNEPKKKEGSNVKFATEIANDVSCVIEYLLKLHSYKNRSEFRKHVDLNALAYLASLKGKFILLKKKLNAAEKANPSLKDLSVVKFCRSIAENDKLHEEFNNLAKKCRNVPPATRYERLYPQLNKMVKNFDMHQLQKQISFLKKLKEKNDFNAIRNDCSDEWDFDDLLIDLIGDEKFKAEYIDKALDEECESFSKSFREDLSSYVDLADQGQEAASKYFGENIEFQAYYAKADDGNSKVLNINLIDHSGRSEPTQISDLLQKEKDICELNIYFNKKHEVHAYQEEGKKRYYEFKDGAYYEMTSTWRAEDESGNISICKMIMNVSSSGITKIVEFNGKKSGLLSKDDLKLVQQNHELHIQDCSLYDSVEKSLGPESTESIKVIEPEKAIETNQNLNDKGTDANQDFENNDEEQGNKNSNDKGIDTNQDFENNAEEQGNQNPNDKGIDANQDFENNAEEQGNQNPNDKGIDANQDFKNSSVAVVCDTQASESTKVSQTEIGTQTEVDLPQMGGFDNLKQEASKLKRENIELKQGIEAGLQVLNQKHNKLMQERQLLLKELKTAQAEKEELKNHIENLSGEKCNLQDEIEKIKREFEEEKGFINQKIISAVREIVELDKRDGDFRAELAKIKQKVKELEQQNSYLRAKDRVAVEKLWKNRNLKAENDKICEELAKLKKEHEEKAKELCDVYEAKEKVEKNLGVLIQENIVLKNTVEKAEEYAEYLMDEKSKAVQTLKSQMLALDQKCKEELKSSNEELEKKSWKCGELQNEIDVKNKEQQKEKKRFEELKGINEELQEQRKELERAFYTQQIDIDCFPEHTFRQMLEYTNNLAGIIEDKTYCIENLKEEKKFLTKYIKILDKDNTTYTCEMKHLIKTNPEHYKLIQDPGDIILPTQLSRSPSSDSCDSGFNDKGSSNLFNSKSAPNSRGGQPWKERVRCCKNPSAIVKSS
ncbi:hypothetical protein [Wolbachia endosymbiont of Folsomia candida]|uniref:hypothetical protein n=1 Tax=Wolbachia endosymbiont of Folsomia candida TaxID=169402 RepID=UPI000AC545C4|nr:hypothetical protein [Wolbachia endosymbiont of Folsomia candida]APR97753.1 hypothetical protein ASM33_00120 [Wolbachia endosymbiont of Folsomia candida]